MVSFFVNFNAEVTPVFFTEFFTDFDVVFANTSSECDSVNAVHSSCVCTNVFCNAVGVSIQSNFSEVVTFFSSFGDISAVGGQAAAHAKQTGFLVEHVENFVNGFVFFVADVLDNKSFLLLDTGGQYLDGTTDVTRTIALGALSSEEKKHYTAVLRGNLNLSDAKFKYGCTGVNLDYLAREALWHMGLDYNHGTGHGVGYLLNVHEGPNAFRYRERCGTGIIMEEGMITSDEPGLYLEGKYGIRLENLLLCKKAEKTEYGQFMEFETLTVAPFDLEAIDWEELDSREKALLRKYQQYVYDTIADFLSEEEKKWLKEQIPA